MRTTEKELLIQYILNNLDFYQNEVIHLKQNLRYRNIDVNDCFELALAIERLQAFEKFSLNIMELLNLKSSDESGENQQKQ